MEHVSYNETLYKSKSIGTVAKAYLKKLPPEVNTLVSRGYSGCSIAAAMLALSKKPLTHIAIKKAKERTHSDVAGLYFHGRTVGAIVDDFVSSGATVRAILRWDKKHRDIIKYIVVGWKSVHYYTSFDIPVIEVEKRK